MVGAVGGSTVCGPVSVHGAGAEASVREEASERCDTAPSQDAQDIVEISDEARQLAAGDVGETDKNATDPAVAEGPDESGTVDTLQQALEKLYAKNDAFGRDEALSEMERMKQQLENLRAVFGDGVALDAFDDRMGGLGYSFTVQIGIGSAWFAPSKEHGVVLMGYSEPGRLMREKMGLTDADSNFDEFGNLAFQVVQDYDHEKEYGTVSIVRNGKTEATYAAVNGYRDPGYKEAIRTWNERTSQLQYDEVGFDVAEYVAGLTGGFAEGRFAAESVSTDLAGTISSILQDAGLVLEKGQELSVYASPGYTPSVHLNFGDESTQKKYTDAFLRAFEREPALLDQFIDEYNSVDLYDIGSFPGQYTSNNRSINYYQERQFVYTGDHPSAVVMGSRLDLQRYGYFVYLKEIV